MIPFFDAARGLRDEREEVNAAIARVLDSGRYVLGPEVEAFELEWAARTGSAHGIGVASGTDALELALRAVGVAPGDEVVTVANAGVPVVAAIRAAGAAPRFADVDREHLLLDPASLEAVTGPRARAIVAVHLYGQAAPLGPIAAFAQRRGLALIEDCAQAHGATYENRPVGSFGRVGCFSFYPTKNLGAIGDAGICVTSDPDVAQRLRALRTYGWDARREARIEGRNSRLDELQAAILRVRARRLDARLRLRERLAALYAERLAGAALRLPSEAPGRGHAWHLYVVRSEGRARLEAALERAGIGFGHHYPTPVHLMAAYGFLRLGPGSLPVTEQACAQVLSLPLHEGIDERAVERVAAAVRDGA